MTINEIESFLVPSAENLQKLLNSSEQETTSTVTTIMLHPFRSVGVSHFANNTIPKGNNRRKEESKMISSK